MKIHFGFGVERKQHKRNAPAAVTTIKKRSCCGEFGNNKMFKLSITAERKSAENEFALRMKNGHLQRRIFIINYRQAHEVNASPLIDFCRRRTRQSACA